MDKAKIAGLVLGEGTCTAALSVKEISDLTLTKSVYNRFLDFCYLWNVKEVIAGMTAQTRADDMAGLKYITNLTRRLGQMTYTVSPKKEAIWKRFGTGLRNSI